MGRVLLLAGVWLLVGGVPVAAQAWDSPTFFSPRPGEDIGLYVVKAEGVGEAGFAGIWRQSGNINLGVRAGIQGDHISVGSEFFGPLSVPGPQSPLVLSWVLGLGATFNDATALRIPLGVSAGMQLGDVGGIAVTPYVHPRVGLDVLVLDDAAGEEDTQTDFNVDVDIGADAAIGDSFVLRVGLTLGETSVFGAGLAYRMGRRLVVR